jgi:signal transduction histidine kinase
MSSMLLEGSYGPVEDKPREIIDRVFQSSQKLNNIIEDFLNITRIELGTMKYQMADIDLAKITETVVNNMRPNIENKGLSLDYGADGGSHIVRGDSGKLEQVVSNVIDNAVKYTPTGSISVAVKEVKGTDGKHHVRVEVKDTGVGIEASTIPKLFEKFIRADDAGKTNITGTGLGLYVAKQIMEGHQGKIWAESAGKGKGSTFIVEV